MTQAPPTAIPQHAKKPTLAPAQAVLYAPLLSSAPYAYIPNSSANASATTGRHKPLCFQRPQHRRLRPRPRRRELPRCRPELILLPLLQLEGTLWTEEQRTYRLHCLLPPLPIHPPANSSPFTARKPQPIPTTSKLTSVPKDPRSIPLLRRRLPSWLRQMRQRAQARSSFRPTQDCKCWRYLRTDCKRQVRDRAVLLREQFLRHGGDFLWCGELVPA